MCPIAFRHTVARSATSSDRDRRLRVRPLRSHHAGERPPPSRNVHEAACRQPLPRLLCRVAPRRLVGAIELCAR
eukprot:2183928-Prymnesium_polylepis.1